MAVKSYALLLIFRLHSDFFFCMATAITSAPRRHRPSLAPPLFRWETTARSIRLGFPTASPSYETNTRKTRAVTSQIFEEGSLTREGKSDGSKTIRRSTCPRAEAIYHQVLQSTEHNTVDYICSSDQSPTSTFASSVLLPLSRDSQDTREQKVSRGADRMPISIETVPSHATGLFTVLGWKRTSRSVIPSSLRCYAESWPNRCVSYPERCLSYLSDDGPALAQKLLEA
jgi:hypothetical protein